ncbi:MAG: hypothetical protein ABI652_05800, partial [Acidobacteriota bacterium]
LPVATRRAFDRVAEDFRRVLGAKFVALVASGPTSSVAFIEPLLTADLTAFGALVETWHGDGLDTPLLLTPDEFRRSLDAFPLEYQAILDRHVVIAGQPPFAGVHVEAAHLRRACEIQAKSHLIHLRQGWLEAAGHKDRLELLVVRSAPPLRALLSNVARLTGATSGDEDPAVHGAQIAGLPDALIRDVLTLEHKPDRADSVAAAFGDYVAAADQLWKFVDAWQ